MKKTWAVMGTAVAVSAMIFTPGGTTGKSPVSSGMPPELTAFSAYGRIISVSPLHSRQISCIITINFTKSGRNDPYFERMKQL